MRKFSTKILDDIVAEKKKQRESERKNLIVKIFSTLNKLSKKVQFDDAYIFGSVAKPYKFTKQSDINIGFIGLSDDDVVKSIAYLSRKLEIDVDVVQLERCRFAKKIMEGIKWGKLTGKSQP